ncbi:MAG: NAD-dependent isocitrate dehydrogenase [Propionibacteriales bacterium]|nr:NAD-dependent isocitrate dehydrogenase [Propionibacteriales bacterium]
MRSGGIAVCVIPGDGIGPEVTACACRVLAGLEKTPGGPSFDFDLHPAGHGTYVETGDAFPHATLEAARRADGVLVGAMDVAQMPAGTPSPLQLLRQRLGVAASIRRSRTYPGMAAPLGELDTLVVREVTEGLYSGIEYKTGEDAACAVRLITKEASAGAARVAFQAAARRSRKVTAVHKLGALKITDSVFLNAAEEIGEEFPEVTFETKNVDACAFEMVREPEEFDVILATNAFGDILSDVAAGLTGGLGLAPSGCVGPRWSYFEPVHGSAPDIAGQGIANPLATILSAALLLHHLGEKTSALAIERAVADVLAAGAPRTPDLGGDATSTEITDAVIQAMTAQS